MTRLLIVAGHEALRGHIRGLLADCSLLEMIGEAVDSPEALRLLQEWKPDIVVIEHSFPLLWGIELSRLIAEAQSCVSVLIYAMDDRSELRLLEILRSGARGCVLHQEAIEHLAEAVEALAKGLPYFSGKPSEILLDHYVDGAKGHDPSPLTTREREVVQLIAEGKLTKEIAYILEVSIKTVEAHRAAIFKKLELSNLAELVRYAVRNNMVEP